MEANLAMEGMSSLERMMGSHPEPIPSDNTITVEDASGVIIVNACFGSKTNMAIAHLLATLLAAKSGASVTKQVDPTRIVLRSAMRRAGEETARLLVETEPELVETLIRKSLVNANEVRWHLLQVARKFGAVRRDADFSRFHPSLLVSRYRGTTIFDEAVESYLWDRMDIPKAVQVMEDIREGRIFVMTTKLSPIGRSGLDRYGDLMHPFRSDSAILRALEQRLMKRRMAIYCISCRNIFHRTPDSEAGFGCSKCGSVMTAGMLPWKGDQRKLDEDMEHRETARQHILAANLVREHGDLALITLAGRGVGPRTAARLLRLYAHDRTELLRGILHAEIQYARTHKFWD